MSYVPFSNINPVAAKGYVTQTLGTPWLLDFEHASKLYRSNNYALAPKTGFIYFVRFNTSTAANQILSNAVMGASRLVKNFDTDILLLTGLLAKSVQLPKFKITTETINQYNRKTNIQTKINYEPVRLEFHDDNADNTNKLWNLYFSYYNSDAKNNNFGDTKYVNEYFDYGFRNAQQTPFFTSIDIYVLHKGDYTKITLINPLITGWDHDTLDQADGTKLLKNSMMLSYETVNYETGQITTGAESAAFKDLRYYDNTKSSRSEVEQSRSNVQPGDPFASAISNVKPPSTGQLTKSLAALGSTLRGIKIAREFQNNPKQAWTVYGFNIKDVLANSLANAIFASAAQVTTVSDIPQQQIDVLGASAETTFLGSESGGTVTDTNGTPVVTEQP